MTEYEEVTVRPEVPVILEPGPTSWGAFAPSLPGVVAVGSSRDEVLQRITEALAFHLRELHRDALTTEDWLRDDPDLRNLADQVTATKTIEEAADSAGVRPGTIRNAIRAGCLTGVLLPPGAPLQRERSPRYVYRQEVERWKAERAIRPGRASRIHDTG